MRAKPLVLASASPRRRQLLAEAGYSFDVEVSDAPEVPQASESPRDFALRVACDKAEAVASRRPDALVLGADTVVALDGAIFGKPADRTDGKRMLGALSGRRHEVITAVALARLGHESDVIAVVTQVEFRPIGEEEIELYLDSGEPFDKAGAYAVQGLGNRFVVALDGSLSNVIGLPLDETGDLLRRHGVVASVKP